ncbi:MAG: hypothetical protein KAJ24_00535 [Candidatus Aenigmarchaeota archaeon]|nr:hypothetical protein [Candidatus Aenigmarchaeota archaeon]
MTKTNIPFYIGVVAFLILLIHVSELNEKNKELQSFQDSLQETIFYSDMNEMREEWLADNQSIYCWADFMSEDGVGFGVRVWNLNISPSGRSDCEILKKECEMFYNLSETFKCSWDGNTCNCRVQRVPATNDVCMTVLEQRGSCYKGCQFTTQPIYNITPIQT